MNIPKIKVGILRGKEIKFDLYGDFYVTGINKKFSGVYSAFLSQKKIIINHEQEEFSFSEVTFEPADPESESFLLRGVKIGIDFHWEKKENQRFLGSLKLIKDNDELVAINILSIEDYLSSVISSEMSSTSSLSLLKAHAIISRSWLLSQIEKRKKINKSFETYRSGISSADELIKWYDREDHKLFDICADDHCQRYQGLTKIINDNAFAAVELTSGLILKHNGAICDTRYSKCCGGITESFKNVWEPVQHPYLQSITDYKFEPDGYILDLKKEKNAARWIKSNPVTFCNTSDPRILSQVLPENDKKTFDFYRWQLSYKQDEIANLINSKSGFDFGNIIDLIPVERGDSGRICKLKIIGSNKTLIVGKELEIRRLLSPSHLYSSAFVVDKINIVDGVPKKFLITGAGWGHGVGLCQIGAAVMGSMGYSFDEILLHYYKDAVIQKVY